MLDKPFLLFVSIVLMVALLVQQPVLVLLCGLVLLAAGLSAVWRRWALHRVEYERVLSDDHVFPDDEITLTTRVVNRKPLPLARLDLLDLLPPEVRVIGVRLMTHGPDGKQALLRSLSLGWYEAVTRRYTLRCAQRGVYFLGPVQLKAGDPFGFFTNQQTLAERTRLVIYPRLLTPQHFPFDLRLLLGEIRSRRRLIVDPSRTIGVRDYQRDDPLKSIHWNATARRGELQTRVYEPTTDLQTICVLDVDTFEQAWEGVLPDEAERLISTTATLAKLLVEDGHSVGLITNGVTAEQTTLVRIAPSRSPFHLIKIMEMLAGLKPYSFTPAARILRTLPASLAEGSTLVLISAISPAVTQDALLRLRQRGHAVYWIYLGVDVPSLPGVSIYHIPPQRHPVHVEVGR